MEDRGITKRIKPTKENTSNENKQNEIKEKIKKSSSVSEKLKLGREEKKSNNISSKEIDSNKKTSFMEKCKVAEERRNEKKRNTGELNNKLILKDNLKNSSDSLKDLSKGDRNSNGLKLSEKVKEYKDKNDITQALGEHYEDLIRCKTGGVNKVIDGFEYDAVTDSKLIQAKRGYAPIHKPDNFLKKGTKRQIKRTAKVANELGLEAEYWFKYGVHPEVRKYIEDKGIKVIEGLGD